MNSPRMLDLFSGIGGFSLAGRWTGYETVGFCEIEAFARAVLAKNFPGVWIHDDILTLTIELIRERCGDVDIVVGGFPCQDISVAGQGAGLIEGKRSSLWFELYRIIVGIRPRVVLVENVPALRNRGADRVLQDMAEAGYTAEAFVVGADDVGASHRRKRIWIVAVANGMCERSSSFTGQQGLHGQALPFCSDATCTSGGTVENSRYWTGRSERRVTRGNYEAGEREQDTGAPSFASSTMADADCAGWGEHSGTLSGGEELSSSQCDRAAVADTAGKGAAGHGFGTKPSFSLPRNDSRSAMADTDGLPERQQEYEAVACGIERDARRETRIGCRNMAQFPPGPAGDWSGIPAEFWPVEPQICSVDDGISARLVRRRVSAKRAAILKGLGNAIVPQVAAMFLEWIKEELLTA